MKIDLIRSEFEDWLKSKHGDEIAGRRGAARRCPLAEYLIYKGGGDNVAVDGALYRQGIGGGYFPLPLWAKALVERIDRQKGGFTEITAAEVLAALELGDAVCD
jgi:hypothetical protein